jgi:hypothetical protein
MSLVSIIKLDAVSEHEEVVSSNVEVFKLFVEDS